MTDPRYVPPMETGTGDIDLREDAAWRRDQYVQIALKHLGRANEARAEASRLMGSRGWDLLRYAEDQRQRYDAAHAKAVEWGRRC